MHMNLYTYKYVHMHQFMCQWGGGAKCLAQTHFEAVGKQFSHKFTHHPVTQWPCF